MNRDDILRMALEAHTDLVTVDYPGHAGQLDPWTLRLLERFAALVEQHLIESGYRKCAVGQRTTQFCKQLEQAVEAEREACAQLCDGFAKYGIPAVAACATAIRARGANAT